jgi:hypothetical protein
LHHHAATPYVRELRDRFIREMRDIGPAPRDHFPFSQAQPAARDT